MFPVWLRDGVALANIPRVICGDSEEVSSEPPRARTPPNDGNYKERGGGFGWWCARRAHRQKVVGNRHPWHACNGAESHRSFVPFPRVSRRRVLHRVERGVDHHCPPSSTSTLPLTRPPISPHPRANSPYLYDVLSPWRFGGQCRPTITRPYLPYYIYVVARGREGLCGVSSLSRATLFFFLILLLFLLSACPMF